MEDRVRGIRPTVEDDRYCVDVLQQIVFLRSAADAVAGMILQGHIRCCVRS